MTSLRVHGMQDILLSIELAKQNKAIRCYSPFLRCYHEKPFVIRTMLWSNQFICQCHWIPVWVIVFCQTYFLYALTWPMASIIKFRFQTQGTNLDSTDVKYIWMYTYLTKRSSVVIQSQKDTLGTANLFKMINFCQSKNKITLVVLYFINTSVHAMFSSFINFNCNILIYLT